MTPELAHRETTLGLSSEELARRAQAGCRASFAELAHRFAPKLERFLYRKTGSRHDAEDLVQETLCRAYQNLQSYRPGWRFSTWLFTIASHEAVSRHRREHRCDLTVPAHATTTDESVENRERVERLWDMAAELPAGQHRALWLRYGEDMSIKEIARAMGRSQVCIKVLLYRARVGLANRWKEKANREDL